MKKWKTELLMVGDTETTGLVHGECRVIELGWLLARNTEIIEQHDYVLRAGKVPAEITDITGITQEACEDGREFGDDVDHRFLEDMRRAVAIVFYNAPFDIGHIEHELSELGVPLPFDTMPVLDPLVYVRHFRKYDKGKKLTQVAARLGIKEKGQAHRAIVDCLMTFEVLCHFKRQLPDDLDELVQWQETLRKEQEASYQRWLAGQVKK